MALPEVLVTVAVAGLLGLAGMQLIRIALQELQRVSVDAIHVDAVERFREHLLRAWDQRYVHGDPEQPWLVLESSASGGKEYLRRLQLTTLGAEGSLISLTVEKAEGAWVFREIPLGDGEAQERVLHSELAFDLIVNSVGITTFPGEAPPPLTFVIRPDRGRKQRLEFAFIDNW
jgi:hypothetical protein